MFLSASNASLCRWPPPPQEFAKHSISSRAQTPTIPTTAAGAESLPTAPDTVALCWQVLMQ